MEKSKGNKASNIFQVLKSAGAWQSKDSQGPIIKKVGAYSANRGSSPLNMKSPNKLAPSKESQQRIKDMVQRKKNAEAKKAGKAVSYKDAYADADKKKYKTYEEFEKAAKDYNKKKYNTTNPTSEAKKQNISKEQLAKNVAEKNKTPETTTTNNDAPKDKDKNIKSTEVAVKSRKQIRNERRAKRLSDKAKDKGSLTKGQRRRLAVAEEKAGGKSGKDARLAANTKLAKKDESVAVMNKKNKNKSAMKMKKDAAMKMKKEAAMKMKKSAMKMKKESAMKMKAKSAMKFNAGLKKAAAAGKLDKNPKFKAAVENAPAKMKKSAMKMKKSAMKMGMKKSAAKMKYKK